MKYMNKYESNAIKAGLLKWQKDYERKENKVKKNTFNISKIADEAIKRLDSLDKQQPQIQLRTVKFLDSENDCVLTGEIGSHEVVEYAESMLETLPVKCTALIYNESGVLLSKIQPGV